MKRPLGFPGADLSAFEGKAKSPTPFALRLRAAREQLHKTQESMAAALMVSLNTYQSYEQGITVPKAPQCALLQQLGVDLNWLLTRSGDAPAPLLVPERPHRRAEGSLAPSPAADLSDYVFLPRYDVMAAAGAGRFVHSERIVDYLAFRADWIRDKLRLNPRDLVLIEASGDSMEPTIAPGDLLLLDGSVERIRDSSVYILSIEGELVVKRIERRLDSVVIKSDNPRYDPETVTLERAVNLRVVGQVVWHGGLV